MKERDVLFSPLDAIHKYASELTDKVRELDKLEREWKINTGESTKILAQMIESYLYTIFKTMLAQNRYSTEDRDAARKALEVLLANNPDLLAPPNHITSNR